MESRRRVFLTTQEHTANLVKDLLEAAGIDTLLLNQKDSMYKAFGAIELYVLTAVTPTYKTN